MDCTYMYIGNCNIYASMRFLASSKRLITRIMDYNYNLDGCQMRNRKKFNRNNDKYIK